MVTIFIINIIGLLLVAAALTVMLFILLKNPDYRYDYVEVDETEGEVILYEKDGTEIHFKKYEK